MLIFAKALVAKSLSLGLGRSRGATKLHVGLIHSDALGRVWLVPICHFFKKMCFVISLHFQNCLFHSGLNTILKTSREVSVVETKVAMPTFFNRMGMETGGIDRKCFFSMAPGQDRAASL